MLRYVESGSGLIREYLVAFLESDSGVTDEALADKSLCFVRNHLDPSKLRGQAYDGASSMASKTKGVAAHISSQYPLALYTHCASHSLKFSSCSFIQGDSSTKHDRCCKSVAYLFLCSFKVAEEARRCYT